MYAIEMVRPGVYRVVRKEREMYLLNSLDYSVWGTRSFDVPSRVRFDPDSFAYTAPAGAVAQAIARKNRLDVANMRQDCREVDRNGNILSTHYQLTLGKAMRQGGFSVSGECWFAIKRSAARVVQERDEAISDYVFAEIAASDRDYDDYEGGF